MARSQGDRMYPALAWYVNSAQTAAMRAPGSRVDPRGVPQRQQQDDLPEDARHQLQVAAKGGEQVPRMRERSDEEDAVVLGINQVPGRNVSDAE